MPPLPFVEVLRNTIEPHVAPWAARVRKAEVRVRQDAARRGMINGSVYATNLVEAWRMELLERVREIGNLVTSEVNRHTSELDPGEVSAAVRTVARRHTGMPVGLYRNALMARGAQNLRGDGLQGEVATAITAEIARLAIELEAVVTARNAQLVRDEVAIRSAIATKSGASAARAGVSRQMTVGILTAAAAIITAFLAYLLGRS